MTTQAGFGIDLPGDFDEDQSAIDRRKAQLIAAMKSPIGGAGSGWAGGIANFLQNAVGTNLLSDQDAVAKDLAQRRAANAEQAFKDWSNLRDKPATPEVNPSKPPTELESLGGGPPLPTTYKAPPPDAPEAQGGMVPKYEYQAAKPMVPVSMADKMSVISRLAASGPVYAKAAEKLMTHMLDTQKGAGDKWEVDTIYDPKTGQDQKVWVNKNNPTQAPIPLGGTKMKDVADPALQQRETMAYDMLRARYPNAAEDELRTHAKAVALRDVMVVPDAAGGAPHLVSLSGAEIKINPGTGPAPAAGTTPPVPGIPTTTPSAAAAPTPASARNARDLAVLQKERADVLTTPESNQKQENLRQLDSEIARLSKGAATPTVAQAAPTAQPGAPSYDPEARYRGDQRNTPYLQTPDVPGVYVKTGPSNAPVVKLNTDVKALGEDYSKNSLPELITAANQIEATAARLAGKKGSGVTKDDSGKYSGQAPGYGGPGGIVNAVPSLLLGDDAVDMRNAMATVNNIMLKVRSGAAVVPQELQRYLTEMGQNVGSNDRAFWNAYDKFKERLSAHEASVTQGYAPIVRDKFFEGGGVPRPTWKSGGGGGTGGKTEVRRGTRNSDGKTVIEYSDGTREVQ